MAVARTAYLLDFTSEYDISEDLHPELPGPEERIVDFSEGKVGDVAVLNTCRTPIQKQPEALLCVVGLSQRYFPGDDVYPTFLSNDDRDIDLFNLISAPNPTKVKTGTRPHVAYEVPLLTATANRVIVKEDATVAPSTVEKYPPKEATTTTEVVQKPRLEKEVAAIGPPMNKRYCKRDNAEAEANALPKVLRKDRAPACPEQSTHRGKSLAAMGLGEDSTFTSTTQETHVDVSYLEPLSYAKPHPYSQSFRVPDIEIPAGGVATTEVPGLFSAESQSQRDLLALGSQLRLRLEQEVRLLKKARAQVARCNERIQVREEEIKRLSEEVKSLKVVETEVHGLRNQTKNLKTLLEAEVDMKKATEAKNAELAKELESLCVKFLDLQLYNNQLSQQVSTLQAQFIGEERIKAIFAEFKKYEDGKVEKHCTEIDARLDALSIDFDEELYPHMLTAITGRRWVIGHGMCLAVMKCAESIELRRACANVVSAGITKGMSEGLEYGIK
ncbi:hypothetical protein Tco_1267006 [Tanacetum coccineum]